MKATVNQFYLTSSIIKKAQQQLLSAQEFYDLCQKLKASSKTNLYFLIAVEELMEIDIKLGNIRDILIFCDYLSRQIINPKINQELFFYISPLWIKTSTKKLRKIKIQKIGKLSKICDKSSLKKYLICSVKIIGEGMIGRVACMQINQGKKLAFKTFFEPNLVWQHGPWAEIPVGIYLQAHQVIKDLPEFKCAGESWTIWEWIEADTKPQERNGIYYQEFAQIKGLTPLNYLNRNNYNNYQIRLDPGGIQKEYFGRRWHDFWYTIIFYIRKTYREGFCFWFSYLNWKNIHYLFLRLIDLILK